MNYQRQFGEIKRQTTADEVYQQLQSDIISFRLAPGTKLSEVEVAKLYDVSRQPVREAFVRLGDQSLLQIRPQKATLVRKISVSELNNTRFIRASVEVEVVRRACEKATEENLDLIDFNLMQQEKAVKAGDSNLLHNLDYEFHRLICLTGDCLAAFKTIAENKTHTDRVCTLELAHACGMSEVLDGHHNIVNAIKSKDEETAVKMTRIHLSHLDDTLKEAREEYPDYFED
ncbi:MAG: GntR family transcriptional regulator [Hyphomicrobiales bacterium]